MNYKDLNCTSNNNIEQLADNNGALDLLAAYIIRDTGSSAADALDLAYLIMDTVDEVISTHNSDEEEDDE